MTEIILDCSLDEARELVVKAFDRTDGISKYQKSQYQVVGETGVSFPRVLWSYGESIFVDLSETDSPEQTKLNIRAEKEVSMNIGANPEKYKRRFLDELSVLREGGEDRAQGQSISEAENTAEGNSRRESTVETMEEGSGSGTNVLMYVMIGTVLFFLFTTFLMMSVMMP